MRHCFITIVLFLSSINGFTQVCNANPEKGLGGTCGVEPSICISESKRDEVLHNSDSIWQALSTSEKFPKIQSESVVNFAWPLRLKSGVSDPGYFVISNFIDEMAGAGVKDYNCGGRSYDGHLGTDIVSWPYPWSKMNANEVEVIAAAAGVIINKVDGNFDQNCSLNASASPNFIVIQHTDGTKSMYFHLKAGMLTSKGIGASVTEGEYLGAVGSSGYSNEPHLHFEVANSANQTIDPWGGSCNNLGGQSRWQTSKQYWDPGILKIATHSAEPTMPACPPEVQSMATTFSQGQIVYFASYFRDRQAGATATYTVKKPDGSIWQTWTQTPTNNASRYWWYWWYTLPANATAGTWRYQVVCNGQTETQQFTVVNSAVCPTPVSTTTSNITSSSALLLWGYVPQAICYTIILATPDGVYADTIIPNPAACGYNYALQNNYSSSSYNGISIASGTTYSWKVKSNCSGNISSPYSVANTFTTSNAPCNSPSTSQISFTNITSNSFRVTCTTPGVLYKIRKRKLGAGWNVAQSMPTGTNYLNVTGLSPCTTYDIEVSVKCSSSSPAWSNFSAIKRVTTTGCNSLSVSPEIVNVNANAGSTSITVSSTTSWAATESASWFSLSPATGSGNGVFVVNYTANTSNNSRSSIITVTSGSIVKTVSVTQAGVSNTTCSPATGLIASNIGQNTVTISWNSVLGATYQVQFFSGGSWVNIDPIISQTSMGLYGLMPNSTYQWRIITFCSNGLQSTSNSSSFNTPTAPNCTGGNQWPPNTSLTPTTVWKYQDQMWGGDYCLMNVQDGMQYTFSFCAADGATLVFDGEMSIRNVYDQLLSYSDNVCGTAPKITWRSNFTGQVRVLLTKYSCQTQSTSSKLAYKTGNGFAGEEVDDRSFDNSTAIAFHESGTDIDFITAGSSNTGLVSISPNPTSGMFTIQSEAGTTTQIRIFDQVGKNLWSKRFTSDMVNEVVDGSTWPDGLYFIQFLSGDGKPEVRKIYISKGQ